MADFSKQWCEINDPEMPYDFDIKEIFKRLGLNSYENWICEGFGFVGVGNVNGDCMLLMPTDDEPEMGQWLSYDEVIR
jgi:hypothetical protein